MKFTKDLACIGIYLYFLRNIFILLAAFSLIIKFFDRTSSFAMVMFMICFAVVISSVVGMNIIKGMIAVKGLEMMPDNPKQSLLKFFSDVIKNAKE